MSWVATEVVLGLVLFNILGEALEVEAVNVFIRLKDGTKLKGITNT